MRNLAFLLLLLPLTAIADSKIVRNTMGGDIDVPSAPNGAVLRTMGGDIRLESSGGDVVAKTMGGNIRVRRLSGSINAGTMGGNVDIEVFGAGSCRSIQASSMGGFLEVTLPREFAGDFEIELEQDDGGRLHRIVSDVPLHITESSRYRWFRKVRVLTATGRSGSGANRVRLSTIGGDITIRTR